MHACRQRTSPSEQRDKATGESPFGSCGGVCLGLSVITLSLIIHVGRLGPNKHQGGAEVNESEYNLRLRAHYGCYLITEEKHSLLNCEQIFATSRQKLVVI